MEFRRGLRVPPLTKYIRGILNQYPDDGQILKELIQNADDADATTIKFLLDESQYSTLPDGLVDSKMDIFQGPSLLVYNDAVFTEEDWNAICMMEESVKKTNLIKTGRFGLGFKSIFHLTDLPTILSGEYFGFIDPHRRYLPEQLSAYNWHFQRDHGYLQSKTNQIEPLLFDLFSSTNDILAKNCYDHTLFRFPLRNQVSDLSVNIYTPDKVLQLFQSLKLDGGESLLFLKSVQRIELYRKRGLADEPELMYSIEIGGDIEKVVQARNSFLSQIQRQPAKSTHELLEMELKVVEVVSGQRKTVCHNWLVYHDYQAEKAALEVGQILKVPPWVGVALQLNRPDGTMQIESSGKLFATLPLPVNGTERTGLEFHIHAYFSMEQNRRHLRWPNLSQDEQELNDVSLIWNQLLVNQCIPAAVVAFYMKATHLPTSTISPCDLYRIMPDSNVVDSKWQPLAQNVYEVLFKEKCFYTTSNGGHWIRIDEGIFFPEDFPTPFKSVIEPVLIKAGVNITTPPEHIRQQLRKYSNIKLTLISSSIVHDALLQIVKGGHTFNKEDSLLLLQYFLRHGLTNDLLDLPLLPLLSGRMASFKESNKEHIFLTSAEHPASLLPHLENRIVQTNLEDGLRELLLALAIKGTTQVQPLTFKAVVENLHHVLPSSWADRDIVNWNPEEEGSHPTIAWVSNLWDYIYQHRSASVDWHQLAGLHLLPLPNPQRLCRISVGKRIVLANTDDHQLPSGIPTFLNKVGVAVLLDCPIVSTQKRLLQPYFQPPSSEGVVGALMAQSLHLGDPGNFYKSIQSIAMIGGECVKDFLTYINMSGVSHLPKEMKMFLRSIPLFETVSDSGFKPSSYVSIEDVPVSWPCAFDIPVPCPVQVIHVPSEKERNILEALDVSNYHRSSFPELLMTVLMPAIQEGIYSTIQVEELVFYIMNKHPNLLLTNSQLADNLSKIQFVQTYCEFEQRSPAKLYDPTNSLLLNSLDSSLFPCSKYTSRHLECLRKMGMKSAFALSLEEFLFIANSLRLRPEEANNFVQFTKELAAMPAREQWLQQLWNVAILPTLYNKPYDYPQGLPWIGCNKQLAKPSEVCHTKYLRQAGSVLPVVNLDESTLGSLGANVKPGLSTIMAQLKQVVLNYNVAEKSRYMLLLDEIYGSLTSFTAVEIHNSLNQYEMTSWIWSGNGFHGVEQVVLDQPKTNLTPYVVSIPAEMEKYRHLLAKCGVQMEIDLNIVLKDIAIKYVEHDANCLAEVQQDLEMVINIVKVLCQGNVNDQDILLPIDTGNASVLRMLPASQCTTSNGSNYLDDKLHVVHKLVPPEVLTKLRVHTLMHRELDGEEFTMEFASFGQHEPLTTRIRSLLEGYSDGLAILKEMIQNADDAGATEINLIYDMRDNIEHRQSLFDPGMAGWQGPTLWIQNNALFRSQDFENITKLNGGTKMENDEAVGAFGLGFNAVYNLTDVPSILSGDTLVIFDPTLRFLGKAVRDKSKPGLKLNINKRRNLLKDYQDQFAPWNGVCGCKLEPDSQDRTYQGTLFRLPLRGYSENHLSEISNRHYTDDCMRDLLKMIYEQGNTMLLFTQNMLNISVSIIPKLKVLPADAQHLFEIKKKPVQYLQSHEISVDLPPAAKMETDSTQKFISECSILKASVNRSQSSCQNDTKSSMIISCEVKTFEASKSLVGQKPTRIQHWIVAHCIQASNPAACTKSKRTKHAVAGIAIGLDGEEDDFKLRITDSQGSYFSFLPLPIVCPLPLHINGVFSTDQARRHLLQKTSHDSISPGGEWNTKLMEGAVCTAYVTALDNIIRLTHFTEDDLSEILPWNQGDSLINAFSKAFWRKVISDPNSSEVFSSPNGMVTFNNAFFLDQVLLQFPPDQLRLVKEIISTELAMSGRSLVMMSEKLVDTLEAIDSEMLKSKVITEERFFLDYFLPKLSTLMLKKKDRDQFLVRALLLKSDSISNIMKSQACIPVSPDGVNLACPKDLVHPFHKARKLFRAEDSRFPFFTFPLNAIILNTLCELGMVADRLDWPDVIKVASCLKETKSDCQIERVNDFLEYINFRLTLPGGIPDDLKENLRQLKFLPAAKRPEKWNLKWKAESEFYNGLEVYKLKQEHEMVAYTELPTLNKWIRIHPNVAQLLGVRVEGAGYNLNVEVVKRQFTEIAHNQDSLKHDIVMKSLEQMYKFLEEKCQSKAGADAIQRLFSNETCILTSSNHLVEPGRCIAKLECCAYPYMCQLHFKFVKYKMLSKTLGIKSDLESEDFICALAEVKIDYGDEPVPTKVIDTICGGWYKFLKKSKQTDRNVETEKEICIPDSKNVLRPVDTLCFDSTGIHESVPCSVAHQMIREDFAVMLGIQTIHQWILSERSHGIKYEQEQNLVTQIQSSLGRDPNGKNMLFNLIRNADSCGASEIHFILDPRSHQNDSGFNKEWKKQYGPSLCVHHNGKLKREDLKSVLMNGRRESLPNELHFNETGFHGVFHVTDTPSVMATLDDGEETLLVYDPTCQYIHGTTQEEPGRQYGDLEVLRKVYPDFFKCYLEEDLRKGTILRLPLRTPDMAFKSKMSKSAKTSEDIDGMLKALETSAFQALLFLTSVTKVIISRINPLTEVWETNEINCTTDSEMSQSALCDFRKHLQLQQQRYLNNDCRPKIITNQSDIFKQAVYRVRITSKTEKEEWTVVQQCGLNDDGEESRSSNLQEELHEIMRGGVAERKTGGNSHMTCFVPFAQRSTLPVCTSGLFVRRNSGSQEGLCNLVKWNNCMTQVIASAYVMLIMEKQETVSLQNYYETFPKLNEDERIPKVKISSAPSIDALIVQSLYSMLSEEAVIMIEASEDMKWFSPSEACFLRDPIEEAVLQGVKLCGIPIADDHALTSNNVAQMMRRFCTCELQYLSPTFLMTFLKSPKYNGKYLSALFHDENIKKGLTIVQAMLNFCQNEDDFENNLNLLPLLVTANGKLDTFDAENPVFKGCTLIKPCSDAFLHPTFLEIFNDVQSPVFKDLNVMVFCNELEKMLPDKFCKNEPICRSHDDDIAYLDSVWDYLVGIAREDNTDLMYADHLCLLKVCRARTSQDLPYIYFYPLSKANEVFLSNRKRGNVLQKLLRKTRFPFACPTDDKIRPLLASWKKPDTVVYAFHAYQKEHTLSIFGDAEFIEYITDHTNQLSTQSLQLLIDFPIFERIDGTYTTLTDQCAYVVSPYIPMEEMDSWRSGMPGIVFLKKRKDFNILYNKFRCHYLVDAHLYVDYIFQHISLFSERGRHAHMNYVFKKLCGNPQVMEAMGEICCVKRINGELCRPRDLYDPKIELFCKMHEEDLPAVEFQDNVSLSALRKSGMRCSVTKEDLAAYAVQISGKISTDTSASAVILEHIRKEVDFQLHSEYLTGLSNIAFIPREPSMTTAIFSDSTNDVNIKLNGSALKKHHRFLSAVAPVIPESYTNGFNEKALQDAGVITTLSCELVARNIRELCETESDKLKSGEVSRHDKKYLNKLVLGCYDYINDMVEQETPLGVHEQLQQILANCCCVRVKDYTFVKPSQTILHLEYGEEFEPYLFRLPRLFHRVQDALFVIGLQAEATTSTYQYVLSMIHAKVGHDIIQDERDISAASLATRQVFNEIKMIYTTLDIDTDLWLLSKSHRLHKAGKMLYCDKIAIEQRLCESDMDMVLIDLHQNICKDDLELFPETHRPRLMTDVVREVVARAVDAEDADLAKDFEQDLMSADRMVGLSRLANHILVEETLGNSSDDVELKIKDICKAVQCIQIRVLGTLKTCLFNNSSRVVPGEWKKRSVFINAKDFMFYMHESTLHSLKEQVYAYKLLADLINEVCDNLFIDYLAVLMVVLSADGKFIYERLDEMNITKYSGDFDNP